MENRCLRELVHRLAQDSAMNPSHCDSDFSSSICASSECLFDSTWSRVSPLQLSLRVAVKALRCEAQTQVLLATLAVVRRAYLRCRRWWAQRCCSVSPSMASCSNTLTAELLAVEVVNSERCFLSGLGCARDTTIKLTEGLFARLQSVRPREDWSNCCDPGRPGRLGEGCFLVRVLFWFGLLCQVAGCCVWLRVVVSGCGLLCLVWIIVWLCSRLRFVFSPCLCVCVCFGVLFLFLLGWCVSCLCFVFGFVFCFRYVCGVPGFATSLCHVSSLCCGLQFVFGDQFVLCVQFVLCFPFRFVFCFLWFFNSSRDAQSDHGDWERWEGVRFGRLLRHSDGARCRLACFLNSVNSWLSFSRYNFDTQPNQFLVIQLNVMWLM